MYRLVNIDTEENLIARSICVLSSQYPYFLTLLDYGNEMPYPFRQNPEIATDDTIKAIANIQMI